MNVSFLIYLAGLCNSLNCICMLVGIALVFFSGVGSLVCILDPSEEKPATRKAISSSFLWGFIFISFSLLMPSKDTAYMMIGSSYLEDTGLPEKVRVAIEKKLDDIINDGRK